ncbi:MAG: hypothetical protein U9N84_10170 [Actinomycetota bacterium]|nr:hypothetical protein [Actinomycetota bacterium]
MKRFLVMLATMAVLVAACGGTTTETTAGTAAATTPAGSDEPQGSNDVSAEETTDTPSGEIDLGEDGVLGLDDFIPGFGAQDFDESDFRAQEVEIQQQIAVCMAAEGFEYVPFVPSDIGGGFGYDEFDEEEYVKQFGFGVSTWVLQEEQFAYDEESDPYADDPNQAIVEAMDDAEREEYFRLLHGGEPDIIANTPQEEIEAMSPEEMEEFYNSAYENWQPDGCMNNAYDEAFGGGDDMAFWEEFGEDFEDVYIRAESDPRIIKAQADWSSCMAEKGHNFPTQQDMYSYFWGDEFGEGEFSKRVNELITWPEQDFGGDFEEGEGSATGGVTVTAVGGAEGDDGEFEYYGPEYDLELLQPLIDEELAVATADYECSQDMRDLFEVVYKDLEQQFVDENMDRLLAFKKENS